MREVIGREVELQLIESRLATVLQGGGGRATVIQGPAGIGKSTVWEAAARAAADAGWRVLSSRAVAGESQLTLTILADLLEPVPSATFAGLPQPQRRALDAALLRDAPGDGPERATATEPRLLGTAVRSLLAELAGGHPLLIAIDDVQWLDPGSAAALAFALRRLGDARVVLLAARRTPLPVPLDLVATFGAEGVDEIEIGPLALGSMNALLSARGGGPPSRPTLVQIHQASAGNPLFALEIARVLGKRGEPPAGEPLPVPADLRELLRERLAATPAQARQVLLDLAILGSADADRLAAVAGRPVDAELARGEEDGLIRRDGHSVAFSHPLHAAAALASAAPSERRAAHARVAASATGQEERARHRALATEGPDEEIAAALEAAAADARRRAAPLAAAELLQLAIRRTPTDHPAELARRRLQLGEELKRAGDTEGAIRELESVAASEERIVRAKARLILASIRYETEPSSVPAVALATAALADAVGDPGLQAHAYAVLGAVDWDDLRNHDRYVAEGERLLAQVEQPDPVVEGLLIGIRCGADFRAGRPLDPALIDRALQLEAIAPAPAVSDRFSASLGTWLKVLDRFDEARTWLERTRQAAIDEGDEGSLPYALAHIPELEVWTGHWGRAEEVAREHLALAEATHLESQRDQALYNLALVHVHQGRVDEARDEIDRAVASSGAAGDDWMLSGVLPLLGLLELSLGYPAAAVGPLERGWEMRQRLGAEQPYRAGPNLIEALAATGRADRAAEVLADQERRLATVPRPSLLAATGRARGLVLAADGRLEEARVALEEALVLHDAAPIAFERARTLLALGQVRRRLRERGAARDAFSEAREEFERLGARIWAERAGAELERTGLRRGSGPELTESERRVAELAASGLTNREVATALFMSPKTVEANLGRVYAKLGIRSRAELGAVIGARHAPTGSGAPGRTNMGDRPM
jgi:DNA-binding CsgD family transcriptional regulator